MDDWKDLPLKQTKPFVQSVVNGVLGAVRNRFVIITK
jgi:hypothetical protein